MKNKRVASAFALFLAGAASAWAAPASHITFTGDSTLHAFSGEATAEAPTWMRQTNGAWRVDLHVRAADLHTGHDKRDRNMWRMLEGELFPTLSGFMEDLPALAPGGSATHRLRLRIHGRELEVPATITAAPGADGAPQLDVHFVVSLQALALKPPAVLGLIRVHDTVDVHVRIPPPGEQPSI